MKKLLLFLLLVPVLSLAQGISFECANYKFTVYEDDTPFEYNFMAGDDINYDYKGRVESIGNIDIDYDYKGRVGSLGNVDIDYDYKGRVESIGGMNMEYDYKGRFSGSSGRIGCNWWNFSDFLLNLNT